jgi:hypothetical protein
LQDQSRELLGGKLEEKVGWKALAVSSNLLIQAFGRDAIQSGKVGIEEHPVTAQDLNCACDLLHRARG